MAARRWPRLTSRADRHRSGSRPRSGSATSSSLASATASPPAKAIRTGRSGCPTKVSASAIISAARRPNIIVRAAPVIKAAAPAKPRTRFRSGSTKRRCGSTPPAIVRCTATRREPPSPWPCNIPTSPSPICRLPAPGPPSPTDCSAHSARGNVRLENPAAARAR